MDLLKKIEFWWKTRGTEKLHDENNDVVCNEGAAVVVSLPEEIIVEILLKIASPKPLMRMKCVCKKWHSLIRDSKFATMHLTRHHHCESSSSLSILVFHEKPMSFAACLSPEQAMFSIHCHDHEHDEGRLIQCYNVFPMAKLYKESVVGSSNGIVCLYSKPNLHMDQQAGLILHLWNPATRELKRLPTNYLGKRFGTFRYNILLEFFYDPLMDDYKVLSVCGNDIEGNKLGHTHTRADMYSLASNSWRKIDDHADRTNLAPDSVEHLWFNLRKRFNLSKRSSGVVNGRYVHWIGKVENKIEITLKWSIVRFDLEIEVFDSIKPPPDLKTTCDQIELGNLYDCLTVLYNSDYTETDIWVMKQYGVTASWTRLFSINNAIPLKMLGLETSGKLVTLKDEFSSSLVWYDLKSTNPSHATEIRGPYYGCQLVSHVQTIFPIGR